MHQPCRATEKKLRYSFLLQNRLHIVPGIRQAYQSDPTKQYKELDQILSPSF
ncbi:hypothetical protein JMJ77_0005423 [Colletotrichum scovillei]|uniref:Uncharacterized protein n=1 Tax=Colletotrichum scovillei TaxID=1209932 RepID=A0A9P7UHF8_9PEZI|nr:hypothetical protein JMJ77_0005423 [Colletotrichum scovillei]KAG7076679.1 hypothetical protein JMJ76_0013940 [Colletotrichum scovillei]KAG7083828.1 hypothetical protein JMJ78_0009270 [Colletotrichum scovillei]